MPAGPRGRVQVVEGRVVTDRSTPLRGVLLPVDVGWSQDDFGLMSEIAQTSGVNTVHVYLENWQQETGSMKAQADAFVALTAQAGLYLVLGIGGGPSGPDHPGNGWFSLEKVTAFWELYAARYAASTHVLFEIQNNPEITCDTPLSVDTISMERSAYEIIRRAAPESHVLLFSMSSVPTLSVARQAVDDVRDVVDFDNASFAMHAEETCTVGNEFGSVVAGLQAEGVPTLFSQLPNEEWQPALERAERLQVSWFHHRWLSEEPDVGTLRTALTEGGFEWCPDQGDFPLPAESCR